MSAVDWKLEHGDIDKWIDRRGWVVFIHHGGLDSWNAAIMWCEARFGPYNDGSELWSPHGFNSRLAIRDPNDAFEFRMRFC